MKVSCIIPVYNGERYLAETLQSVLDQTFGAVEILVVDDGSTDGTAALVASFGQRVRYLSQPNAGDVTARNTGVRHASGELIGFLDSDDLWHPDKLTLQCERFQARPELDLCVTMVETFWSPDVPESERMESDRTRRQIPGYTTGTLLARRSLFDRVGPFDTRLSHAADTAWFMAARESGAVEELLDQPLMRRRLHGGNRSRTRAQRSREEYLALIKAKLDRQRSGSP